MVEGIASFVIVQSMLEKNQNTILVWFIVLFPCLVLVVFYLLVTKHHEKLYSPSDYRDEQNFMKSYNNTTRTDEIKIVTNEQNIEREIVGRYAKENPGSGNVLKKLGFQYEKDIPYECNRGSVLREGIQCRLYLN